ncbi:MAG: hypothetical protein JJ992_28510, partial [Planctomycetes bacterium]|nr:hypothetical protein [Planctomycetota bacterium]
MLPRKVQIGVWAACIAAAPSSFAQHLPTPGALLARTNWCRLDIVGGRVRAVQPRLGHKATVTAESPDGMAAEILAFCATDFDSVAV